MRRLRLAAYGNTLYLKGIAACLASQPGLSVVLVDPDMPDVWRGMADLEPDAVAFELGNPLFARTMELLHERPSLLLIALDPQSEEILVLSSQRVQPTTANELADVLLKTVAPVS